MKLQTQYRVLLSVGTFLVLAFVILMACFGAIYKSVVDDVLVIREGKPIMDVFIQPPVPIYMNFVFFNVKNPREVQYYGEKPILEEIGPYVYEETRIKRGDAEGDPVAFDNDGETVLYRNEKYYVFQPDMSGDLSEQDTVTTVNVVMAMLAAVLNEVDNIGLIWPEIEATMDVFETHTISELLFDGWELPVFNLDFSNSGIAAVKNITFVGTVVDLLEALDLEVPEAIANNRIGYFSFANNTNDGLYEVFTGKHHMDEYIYVQEWQQKTELTFWGTEEEKDPYCNMINGSDGTQYPPDRLDENSVVYIFVTQLCRSLYLVYDYAVDYLGVKVLRYVAPPEMLQSSTMNPDNACYCSSLGCLGSSLLEMTPCIKIPLIMSTPHYFLGDGDELSKYIGLNPVEELHGTILYIETKLGVPVYAHKRLQINIPLMPYGNLTSFMNFNRLYFPVFWVDENAEMSQEDMNQLDQVLTLPFALFYSIGAILIVAGLVMVGFGLKKKNQHKKRQTV